MKDTPHRHEERTASKPKNVVAIPQAATSTNPLNTGLPLIYADTLPRSDILDHLDDVFRHKLILIESPVGYGKTLTLAQWALRLHRCGVAVFWADREQTDFEISDFSRLLHSFRANQNKQSAINSDNNSEDSHHRPFPVGERLLVIDEYHLVSSKRTDAQLSRLIDNLQIHEHLALAVRSRPKISWAKRFAAGDAVIVGADHLKFTSGEVRELLGNHSLTDKELSNLDKLFAGWPAAYGFLLARLRKSAIEITDASLTALFQDVESYLCEEIYDELSAEQQQFLMQLCVVTDFSADLAHCLTGRDNASNGLRELIDRNLFLSEVRRETEQSYTYQFHPVFKKFLLRRLQRQGEARIKELHQLAAEWYAKRNDTANAAYHSAHASDIESAANIIETAGAMRIGIREGIPRLKHYLNQIPTDIVHNFPRIELANVYYLMKNGKIQEALDRLEIYREQGAAAQNAAWTVESELDQDFWIIDRFVDIFSDRPLEEAEHANIEKLLHNTPSSDLFSLCFLNILRYFYSLRGGHLDDAKRAAEKSQLWCEDLRAHYWSFYTDLHLGNVLLLQAQTKKARMCFENAARTAADMFPLEPALQIQYRAFMAATLLEANELEAADDHARGLLNVIDMMEGWFDFLAVGFTTVAAVRAEQDGLFPALTVLKQAHRVADKRHMPRLKIMAILTAADLCSLHNNITQATLVFRSLDIDWERDDVSALESFTWRERITAQLTQARMLTRTQRAASAVPYLDKIILESDQRGWGEFLLKARILKALALEAAGKKDIAIAHIVATIDNCMQQGLKRILLEEGEPMRRLLRIAVRECGLSAMHTDKVTYISELLLALNRVDKTQTEAELSPIFTGRELEILEELTKGNSNKQIARNLDIEGNTVKFHLHNIYEKLGVNRRELAIALAQKLSLVKNQQERPLA
ncbi:LuxR C-terminal-related transcriptional regulator [Kineobactrum salinum]|uniref:HTH luxR-type domain-containing protein n=1 Tax=Kineobactrum salinum TaxID=2708301 RepID=A0A6C0U2H1_9GAMM|nr:LuxR C-terminal-related transcriptional regulator [Kineobactrum salinum]QIB66118.1 hypothetical protein G3T16_12545 [Kineobactrum salinum]